MSEDQWCVVRVAGPRTLALVKSLERAGFEVWTPTETVTKRVPRANIKRKIEVALLPSYLFARADRIADLYALANDPAKAHAEFRLMRKADLGCILIADSSLNPLRSIERRRKPLLRPFERGEVVRLTEGGFAGLTGTVEDSRGKFVQVAIAGLSMKLMVAGFHLSRDERKAA